MWKVNTQFSSLCVKHFSMNATLQMDALWYDFRAKWRGSTFRFIH